MRAIQLTFADEGPSLILYFVVENTIFKMCFFGL